MVCLPSIPAVMLHGLIKVRMEKINQAIRQANTPAEKVACYRRELPVEIGSLVPGDCRIEDGELGGRPATWIKPADAPADRAILYLHGGGYIGGSVLYSRNSASDLARCCNRALASLDYRLAPEHPYPAASQDVVNAYEHLLRLKYQAKQIVLAGESAGGGLALASVFALKQAGLPLPGAIIGLSPWCDLTLDNITVQANNGKDIMVTADFLDLAADLYAAGQDRTVACMSPLFGDFTDYPPLLLQVAAEELLLGEVITLANKAKHSRVDVELDIFDGMWHVWQSLNELVPESRAALDKIASFIRRHT